jgi:uncharacterized protein
MEEPVKSPCRNICKYNQHRICVGCLRSLDEIMRWPKMSNDERREVLGKIDERKKDQTGLGFYDGYYF